MVTVDFSVRDSGEDLALDGLGRIVLGGYADFNNDSNFAVTRLLSTYDFSGFFSPVDRRPVWNQMEAGKAVAIRFKLGGDQGMDVLSGTRSRPIACPSNPIVDLVEQTVTPSGGLTYAKNTGIYSFPWTTSPAWAGTCRVFVMELADGSRHPAFFKF